MIDPSEENERRLARLGAGVSVVRHRAATPSGVVRLSGVARALLLDGAELHTGNGDVFELVERPRWWQLHKLPRLWAWWRATIEVLPGLPLVGGTSWRARHVRRAPSLKWTDGGI